MEEEKVLDEVDLEVARLLGNNPYPNNCNYCGLNPKDKLVDFFVNVKTGNAHCSKCEKRIKFWRIQKNCLGNEIRMRELEDENKIPSN